MPSELLSKFHKHCVNSTWQYLHTTKSKICTTNHGWLHPPYCTTLVFYSKPGWLHSWRKHPFWLPSLFKTPPFESPGNLVLFTSKGSKLDCLLQLPSWKPAPSLTSFSWDLVPLFLWPMLALCSYSWACPFSQAGLPRVSLSPQDKKQKSSGTSHVSLIWNKYHNKRKSFGFLLLWTE